MRLYQKKLRSVEDLERERKLLQKEVQRIEEEGFLSVDGVLGSKGKGGGGIESLIDILPISNPMVAMLLKLVQRKFAAKAEGSKYEPTKESYPQKKGKSPIKSIAIEFIGGYLKWKAIELSYKGIRHLMKKRKEKKDAGY